MVSDKHKGVAALAAVTVLWVSTSELIQLVEDEGYKKPLFVTLCSLSCLSIFNIKSIASKKKRLNAVQVCTTYRYPILLFAVGWLLANVCFNAALEMTTVASTTTLSSTSSAFTLFMGWMFGTELATKRKIIAAACSMAGVLFVTLSDSRAGTALATTITASPPVAATPIPTAFALNGTVANDTLHDQQIRSLVGDSVAFLGAFLYAGYLTIFQKQVGDQIDTEVFLGLVGLVGIAMLPLSALEGYAAPSDRHLIIIITNGVISTAVGNRLWLYGSLKCGPMAATLALSASIPVAGVVDLMRGKMVLRAEWLLGALFICTGFVFGTLDGSSSSSSSSSSGGGGSSGIGGSSSANDSAGALEDGTLSELLLVNSDWDNSEEDEPVRSPLHRPAVTKGSTASNGNSRGKSSNRRIATSLHQDLFSFKKKKSKD